MWFVLLIFAFALYLGRRLGWRSAASYLLVLISGAIEISIEFEDSRIWMRAVALCLLVSLAGGSMLTLLGLCCGFDDGFALMYLFVVFGPTINLAHKGYRLYLIIYSLSPGSPVTLVWSLALALAAFLLQATFATHSLMETKTTQVFSDGTKQTSSHYWLSN